MRVGDCGLGELVDPGTLRSWEFLLHDRGHFLVSEVIDGAMHFGTLRLFT